MKHDNRKQPMQTPFHNRSELKILIQLMHYCGINRALALLGMNASD